MSTKDNIIGISSQEEKNRLMKKYKMGLIAAGMPEYEVNEKVEDWCEVNWTQDDWKDWYGVESDEELENAVDSDDYWNED